MDHANATKLLNNAWDFESDDIAREAKSIYESGFYAALNACTPLLYDAMTVLNAHSVGYKTQEAIEKFLEGRL